MDQVCIMGVTSETVASYCPSISLPCGTNALKHYTALLRSCLAFLGHFGLWWCTAFSLFSWYLTKNRWQKDILVQLEISWNRKLQKLHKHCRIYREQLQKMNNKFRFCCLSESESDGFFLNMLSVADEKDKPIRRRETALIDQNAKQQITCYTFQSNWR